MGQGMKDFRRVIWDFRDHGGIPAALRMLNDLDLRLIAQQETHLPEERPDDLPAIVSWIDDVERSYGSVDLEKDDPRLGKLIAYLETRGIAHSGFEFRRYDQRDRDRAAFLAIPWCDSLSSRQRVVQTLDLSAACRFCGVGARVVWPLAAPFGPKKRPHFGIESGACGGTFTSDALRNVVEREALSGLRFGPVVDAKRRLVSGAHAVEFAFTWPAMAPTAVFHKGAVCDGCRRSGPAFQWGDRRELEYDVDPAGFPDFGVTWEHSSAEVASTQLIELNGLRWSTPEFLVSQRARRALIKGLGVKLWATPIMFVSDRRK